ncbi:MAG: hypothetical protein HYS13_23755 [Planctomycetia bacterium]|nr:hypothetical protein [Planctomycetia bacterium]
MTRFFVLLTALAALLLPQSLFGQDRPRQNPGELFDRLDANKDGVVTKDEVGEERAALFDRVLRGGDKDKDGKLTKEEFTAGLAPARPNRPEGDRPGARPGDAPQRPEFNPEQLFGRLDANGDGKVTKEEAERQPFAARLFERADADKDGVVTKEEFQKAAPPAVIAPPGGPAPEGALFRALDANGDGKIGADELEAAAANLKKLDRNGDGTITREEVAPRGRPGAPLDPAALRAQAERRLKEADKNGDGKISKEEAPEQLQGIFDRIDGNKDGFIDLEEMRAMAERFPGRRPDGARPDAPRDSNRRPEGRPGADKPGEKKAAEGEKKAAEGDKK